MPKNARLLPAGCPVRRLTAFGWLLLATSITACTTPTKHDPAVPGIVYESIEARQQTLSTLTDWTALGRISLSTPDEGFSAAMSWEQANSDYAVELTALLGQRAFNVSQQGSAASLKARGRSQVSGQDAEQLLLRELGVRVPLAQFGFWMRGLPGSLGQPAYGAAGRLQQLDYLDPDGTNWVASFKRYKVTNARELPELIDVKGGDYTIRLLIKSWKWQQPVPTATTPADPSSPQPAGRLSIPNA